jgi:serine/threonine protein kinase
MSFLDEAVEQLFKRFIGKEFIVDGRTYVLCEKLGVGGQGCVFSAQLSGATDADYVIKILFSGQNDTELDRGLLEVEAGTLNHPNLVKAIGIGGSRDGKLTGILFERVWGISLRKALDTQGSQPLTSVLQWGIQLADVLMFIHKIGLVHRDIKPTNIMITTSDHIAKLTDFGLCYNLNDSNSITKTGGTPGTLDYMSPEQQHGTISVQSDIYSLGLVLYEAVNGQRFRGTEKINIKNSPTLTAVVSCCLQPKCQDRYPSATLLKEDLQAILNNQPIKHAPKIRNRQYHRFLYKVTVAVITFGVVFAVILWRWNGIKVETSTDKEKKESVQFILSKDPPFRLLNEDERFKPASDLEYMQLLLNFNNNVNELNSNNRETNNRYSKRENEDQK